MNGELYITNSSTIYKIVDTDLATTYFETDKFALYPNPANESFTIKSMNGNEITKIELFDTTGKLLLSKENLKSDLETIDVSTRSKGVYIVNSSSLDGSNYVSKMVKE